MRKSPILLAVLVAVAACDDAGGPSLDGTLVVSTSTEGTDPDQDGYVLTIDGVDSLALDPTGTAEVDLPAGQHTLRLFGVAEHCLVAPGTSLEVNVTTQGRTSVAFEVNCPATGARITVTTTGLDLDLNGYHIDVDGIDHGTIAPDGTALTRLDPGSRTITLTGLTANCTIDGPDSRAVTIQDDEVAAIEFEVVCTATSGVIGVVVEVWGAHVVDAYLATVDRTGPFTVEPPGPAYRPAVPDGEHVVSLHTPANCSVEPSSQSVTVTVGGVVRDTVEVNFTVTCQLEGPSGTLRITAPTTGPLPDSTLYRVMHEVYGYWDYGGGPLTYVGVLQPNDTLVVEVVAATGWNHVYLMDIPPHCSVSGPNPTDRFTVAADETIHIEFSVECSP